MSSEAQRFAEVVLAAFRAAGHYTDEEVGDAGGPSTTTMTKLRKVANGVEDMKPPRSDTLRRIDNAANWPRGSARILWHEGVEPVATRGSLRTLDQDDARTRLRKIAEQNIVALVREAEREATSIRGTDPERADALLADAAHVAVELRRAVDQSIAELDQRDDLSEVDDELPAAAKTGQIEDPGENSI